MDLKYFLHSYQLSAPTTIVATTGATTAGATTIVTGARQTTK